MVRSPACGFIAFGNSAPPPSLSARLRLCQLREKWISFKIHTKELDPDLRMSGCHIAFGKFALQALEPAWIKARQIEAGRRALARHARGGGKIWVRLIPDKPVTMKPPETRMGKGKGAVAYHVAVVKPGRILYEMGGVSESTARRAISLAAAKMPTRTRFISLE